MGSIMYDVKAELRFLRKKMSRILKSVKKREFAQVLYVTLDEPPVDYILAFRQQYPDKVIKVLTAVDEIEGLENTNIHFEYYLQNRMNTARLYKFPKTRNNIEIYGLYSSAFFNSDLIRFWALL